MQLHAQSPLKLYACRFYHACTIKTTIISASLADENFDPRHIQLQPAASKKCIAAVYLNATTAAAFCMPGTFMGKGHTDLLLPHRRCSEPTTKPQSWLMTGIQAPDIQQDRQTDRVVSALQPTWLIGLGRARTRDQPVSRRKGYPDRFRRSPPRSSVDAIPDLIVLFLPCQVVGDVTPTPCAPPSKGRPLAPAEAYPAARGVRRQGGDKTRRLHHPVMRSDGKRPARPVRNRTRAGHWPIAGKPPCQAICWALPGCRLADHHETL